MQPVANPIPIPTRQSASTDASIPIPSAPGGAIEWLDSRLFATTVAGQPRVFDWPVVVTPGQTGANQSASAQPSAVEAKFARLAAEWKADNRVVSSGTRRILHPAYQRIIGLGPEVIPLLLMDLPNDWFYALLVITDEDPVSPADQGNRRAMTDAWRQWGRTRGYIK